MLEKQMSDTKSCSIWFIFQRKLQGKFSKWQPCMLFHSSHWQMNDWHSISLSWCLNFVCGNNNSHYEIFKVQWHLVKILCAPRRKIPVSLGPLSKKANSHICHARSTVCDMWNCQTVVEKCNEVPSFINHISFWMESGTACNKLESTSSKLWYVVSVKQSGMM